MLRVAAMATPVLFLMGCEPAPQPYYANRPVVVAPVVMAQPEPTTHYVYSTVNSTSTINSTSHSDIHIYTNHPLSGETPPPPQVDEPVQPVAIQPPAAPPQDVTSEPPPPEEAQPRAEPAMETPEPPAPEEQAPAAEPPPPEEQAPAAEPPSDSSSDSDGK